MKLTPRTLRERTRKAGFPSVAALAAHLGRNRTTLHHAVRYPERYGRTYKELQAALAAGGAR